MRTSFQIPQRHAPTPHRNWPLRAPRPSVVRHDFPPWRSLTQWPARRVWRRSTGLRSDSHRRPTTSPTQDLVESREELCRRHDVESWRNSIETTLPDDSLDCSSQSSPNMSSARATTLIERDPMSTGPGLRDPPGEGLEVLLTVADRTNRLAALEDTHGISRSHPLVILRGSTERRTSCPGSCRSIPFRMTELGPTVQRARTE